MTIFWVFSVFVSVFFSSWVFKFSGLSFLPVKREDKFNKVLNNIGRMRGYKLKAGWLSI